MFAPSLEPDNELFEQKQGLIRTIYDQTCGTSGFLTDMMNYVEGYKDRYNVAPVLVPYGQELQPETHAVALGSMLLKKLESDPSRDLSQNIKLGSTLSQDHYSGQHFHYQCSKEGANKQVISSQADSLIKISRIWADFFPANTSNQPI